MHSKGLGVFALLASLLVSSAALPEKQTVGDNILQKILSRRDSVKDPGVSETRAERRARLSEDDREIMAKQLMHAISELMNSDCMSDRDYQGWVDFGRRDAEMP
ncbi:gastrin/cholecystokinin-like peptide [Boleophthalmus pectinirostris]|uniref:gastrin/cholecystokinin-like peptide n=1 Tax=Boleophthalmus pectinirostris TaxID=150288 RepID=UPI000A1C7641|nr:gastrin/cholecystokinin-like peptide [Boleophthalmus pectinirostris]